MLIDLGLGLELIWDIQSNKYTDNNDTVEVGPHKFFLQGIIQQINII
jgi:hypothetical protein